MEKEKGRGGLEEEGEEDDEEEAMKKNGQGCHHFYWDMIIVF